MDDMAPNLPHRVRCSTGTRRGPRLAGGEQGGGSAPRSAAPLRRRATPSAGRAARRRSPSPAAPQGSRRRPASAALRRIAPGLPRWSWRALRSAARHTAAKGSRSVDGVAAGAPPVAARHLVLRAALPGPAGRIAGRPCTITVSPTTARARTPVPPPCGGRGAAPRALRPGAKPPRLCSSPAEPSRRAVIVCRPDRSRLTGAGGRRSVRNWHGRGGSLPARCAILEA